MREWLRSREKAVYRVVNASLLTCMVLFGAEKYLGIEELTWIHFAAAFVVLGALAGINYMTARGRILCLALLLLLLCACLAAGPGSSLSFWQSFFPWLVGSGELPQGWETEYGLLQTAMLAAVCYLLQILFEKVPLLKAGVAVILSGILVYCLWSGQEMGHFGVAFLICFIILVWEEWVQKAWNKRRGKKNCPKAHTVWILFFMILYFGLLAAMPVPEKPYDWLWAKNIYRQIQESVLIRSLNRKWGSREGFGMSFTGFSQEGALGGDLQEDEREVMSVRVQTAAVDDLYLTGMVYDSFDGREWSRTGQGYEDEAILDTAQTLYAVRSYDREYQRDYLREIRVDIRYADFQTGYLFAPLKTWALDGGGAGRSLDYTCDDGALRWIGQKGYGTEYGLQYLKMNGGQLQFDLFLEEAGKAYEEDREGNREIWELVMIECERRIGRVFALEDLEDYRVEVYKRYLGQSGLPGGTESSLGQSGLPNGTESSLGRSGLSREVEDYLGEILGDAETDIEKLRAIEAALSALTYTLTPGELPGSVTSAGDFLDYSEQVFIDNHRNTR